MHRLLAALFVVFVLFPSTNASAAACNPGQSPFGDVPQSAIFCKEALWLRNALVTLGCGDGSNYCPGESVSRAQMALFMNRLAVAMTVDTLVAHDQTGSRGIWTPAASLPVSPARIRFRPIRTDATFRTSSHPSRCGPTVPPT